MCLNKWMMEWLEILNTVIFLMSNDLVWPGFLSMLLIRVYFESFLCKSCRQQRSLRQSLRKNLRHSQRHLQLWVKKTNKKSRSQAHRKTHKGRSAPSVDTFSIFCCAVSFGQDYGLIQIIMWNIFLGNCVFTSVIDNLLGIC